ncbi:PREDICTED: uncharacterized protein LOC105149192 [Acromyrmex echinatior]|uniref:uncharacterized protein LOC105149192 n=1 Tax=Acromyrmex echinatior TaxID=103372 RepID=UPI000580F089|nr:PREDICTED: uncharacterized protein LOC105149192 [Acromyrmex echinatior]
MTRNCAKNSAAAAAPNRDVAYTYDAVTHLHRCHGSVVPTPRRRRRRRRRRGGLRGALPRFTRIRRVSRSRDAVGERGALESEDLLGWQEKRFFIRIALHARLYLRLRGTWLEPLVTGRG